MSDKQGQQIKVAQPEKNYALGLPTWGVLPSEERQRELDAMLRSWGQLSEDEQAKRLTQCRGPFAYSYPTNGSATLPGTEVPLSVDDVFYLAIDAVASVPEPTGTDGDREAAAGRLIGDLYSNRGPGYVDLSGLHLEGANLEKAHLKDAYLFGAHLENTNLNHAHLERANLSGARLEGADLSRAYLEHTDLSYTYLVGSNLSRAYLQGANLSGAHLEHASLSGAFLQGANLTLAFFDAATNLENVHLADSADGNISLADVRWGGSNLSVVDWEPLKILGDETQVRRRESTKGKRQLQGVPLDEYKAAVRAYRQLAVALQTQGLSEVAAHYAFRAQLLQRRVLRAQGLRKLGQYLLSWLLYLLAGYGYRLWRIFVAYGLTVGLFAAGYLAAGILAHPGQLPAGQAVSDALQISLNAIHGRVFFVQFGLDTLQSWLATAESIVGILIEGVFVAMLIQRFFGR